MATTGWTMPITVPGASYAPGASTYSPTYAAGASIYTPTYLVVENGDIIYNFPVNIIAPSVSGTAQVGQVLSCDPGTWEGKPTIAYSYLWIRDTGGAGTPIVGATSANYTVQVADLNYKVHCQVTASNDFGTGVAQSNSSATVAEGVPTNTVLPVISGTATVGQTLSCTTGTWSSVSTPTYAYQWKRAGSAIGGATSSTYVLVSADYGNTITCTVTATNTAGSTPATSSATGTVGEASPVNTVAPAATGYVFYGVQLSCTTGTWTSVTTPTYTYQWKRNGSSIGGATSSTYTCVEADEGQSITCSVTATNTNGGTAASSNTLTNWLPSALSPTLWLDANKPSSLNSTVNGDPIGSWVDRSSNAVTYSQATSSKKPTYATNQINGKPALNFSAASQQNLTESSINTVASGSAFTVVVVAKLSSFDQAYKYMACFKASSGSPAMALSTNASYQDMFFGDDVSATKFFVNRWTTISTTTSWHYYSVFYNGSGSNTAANYTGSVDSTPLTRTSTSGNDGAGKNVIGSYKDSVIYNWNGYIAEVIAIPSQVTGSNLTSLQGYLSAKYGL